MPAGRHSPKILSQILVSFYVESYLTQRKILLAIEDCWIIRSMDSLDNKEVNIIFSQNQTLLYSEGRLPNTILRSKFTLKH